MKFTEAQLEQAVIELLKQQNIQHRKGATIARKSDEVLIKEDLIQYLKTRYSNISPNEITSIIRKLEVLPNSDIYLSNKTFMQWLSNGFLLKREAPNKKDLFIELIDYSKADNNRYKFVNQLEITGFEKRIPDGILYINGLPLVVFEFKSAIRENATLHEAYQQLTVRYRRDIPELFKYNAFCVISDGVNTKAGSFFAPYEFFYAWRESGNTKLPLRENIKNIKETKDIENIENSVSNLFSLVKGMLNKNNIRQLIHHFIYLPDNSGNKEIKIVCRYPQFYAANKLLVNIKEHQKPKGDGKGGTYFGATGCGKSFTMLFLTRLLMRNKDFSSPTIIVITDRTDLDDQLSGQFTNAKQYIGDNTVVSVESRADLREKLQGRQSGGVFLTTIHKFTEDIEVLTDRTNIICISDEAHRSQINLNQKIKFTDKGVKKTYGFAKYLHDSLPNATYVGFTGTPIDATLDVFGDIIESYTMTESVKDEITVRIVYEGRAAKVVLNNAKLQEIEDYYQQCVEEGASEYQVDESKKSSATMNTIIGDPDRIKAVANDFVTHYTKRIEEGSSVKGKAMFVCSSRETAYNFYKNIIKILGERNSGEQNSSSEKRNSNLGKRSSSSFNKFNKHYTKNYGNPEEWHSGNLPHRNKKGLLQFITFRLADSLPQEVLKSMELQLKKIDKDKLYIENRKMFEKHLNAVGSTPKCNFCYVTNLAKILIGFSYPSPFLGLLFNFICILLIFFVLYSFIASFLG